MTGGKAQDDKGVRFRRTGKKARNDSGKDGSEKVRMTRKI
jgi:hypothetical protein